MLTFQDQYTLGKEITGLADSTSVGRIKRDINQGGTMFMSLLRRAYTRQQYTRDITASTQYYRLTAGVLRITEISANDGNQDIPLIQVFDERTWLSLNQVSVSGTPTHFFVRGFTEFGVYPTPSATITDGFTIVYEPKHQLLTQDDFTTGTVAVVNGDATITHSATGFTAGMVGRWLIISDGTDGRAYQIASYTDTSHMELVETYQGTSETITNGSWKIGEVMDLPEEYLEAPVDYAMYRHFTQRGDKDKAAGFKQMFADALDSARNVYGSQTSSNIVWATDDQLYSPYNPVTGTPPTIT